MMELAPISIEDARAYFSAYSAFRGEFNLAISVNDTNPDEHGVFRIHGVIAMNADGDTFALSHISTDGSAHVGSLLYGGAWRVAKALGYKLIGI